MTNNPIDEVQDEIKFIEECIHEINPGAWAMREAINTIEEKVGDFTILEAALFLLEKAPASLEAIGVEVGKARADSANSGTWDYVIKYSGKHVLEYKEIGGCTTFRYGKWVDLVRVEAIRIRHAELLSKNLDELARYSPLVEEEGAVTDEETNL